MRGKRAKRRSGVGRSAPETRRHRQPFDQPKPPHAEAGRELQERARGFENEVVVIGARVARRRPLDGKRQAFGGRKLKPVANPGECDGAVDFVETVVAPRQHMQRQVHFGRGAPKPLRRRRASLPPP